MEVATVFTLTDKIAENSNPFNNDFFSKHSSGIILFCNEKSRNNYIIDLKERLEMIIKEIIDPKTFDSMKIWIIINTITTLPLDSEFVNIIKEAEKKLHNKLIYSTYDFEKKDQKLDTQLNNDLRVFIKQIAELKINQANIKNEEKLVLKIITLGNREMQKDFKRLIFKGFSSGTQDLFSIKSFIFPEL